MPIIKTNAGRIKRIRRYKGEIANLPNITHVAVGDGGKNSDGSLKVPNGLMTALYNELYRTTVTFENVDDFTSKFVCLLNSATTPNLVGKDINEIALIDSEGTLITIETFSLFGSGGYPANSTTKIKTQLTCE
ncbi:MAG: phage tail protein [Anaerotignaceae bacterium]